MKKKQNEKKDVEDVISEMCIKNNINVYGINGKIGSKNNGVFDLLLLHNREAYFLETKAGSNNLSKEQEIFGYSLDNSFKAYQDRNNNIKIINLWEEDKELTIKEFISLIKSK